LQNHPPVIKDYTDVLRMVKEVNSPNLKVCLDAPLLLDKSAAAIEKAAQAVGPLQTMTHFGGEYQRQPDGSLRGIDRWSGVITGETNQYYHDFARAMREINFNGSITYELCHDLPLVDGKPADIEFAHENAKMAVEFMRGIIKNA
jgi:sugar phosphate isomerase/epimerase